MNQTIKQLQSGKYNVAWTAVRLYPDMKERAAIAKLHNKLKGNQGRGLTDAEIQQIETILK